jgi:hypothetical protein
MDMHIFLDHELNRKDIKLSKDDAIKLMFYLAGVTDEKDIKEVGDKCDTSG